MMLGHKTRTSAAESNREPRPFQGAASNLSDAWFAYLILVALFIPSVVLILGDRSVWAWDLAIYGRQSVELYNTLIASPLQWIGKMVTIGDDRPIAIAWLGQFFVPVGRLLN